MQVVAVEYQFQLHHIKNNFIHLVKKSILLIIGFNALMKIIITESLSIKVIRVSYSKQSRNCFLHEKVIIKKKHLVNNQVSRWVIVYKQDECKARTYKEKAIE